MPLYEAICARTFLFSPPHGQPVLGIYCWVLFGRRVRKLHCKSAEDRAKVCGAIFYNSASQATTVPVSRDYFSAQCGNCLTGFYNRGIYSAIIKTALLVVDATNRA
jgi:hypothetical protein